MAGSSVDTGGSSKPSGSLGELQEIAQEIKDVTELTQEQPNAGVADIVKLFRDVLTQFHKDLQGNTSKDNQEKPDENSKAKQPSSRTIIPEVRKVDFEHFKNRFNEDDGRYMLEVLVAGSDLAQAVRVEGFKRNGVAHTTPAAATETPISGATVFPPDSTIRRIRIQSKAILNYLSKFSTEAAEFTETRTFLYPFRPLLHSYENMRHILHLLVRNCDSPTDLTKKRDDQELGANNSNQTREGKKTPSELDAIGVSGGATEGPRGQDPSAAVALDPGFDTVDTLAEIKAYVTFVEDDLLPLMCKYNGNSKQTVVFEDLWLLFKPGEYIVVPTGPQSVWKRDQNIFRRECTCIHSFYDFTNRCLM